MRKTTKKKEEDKIREPEFLEVKNLSFRPTGCSQNLLQNVNLSLPEKSLGLIYGRSGSGKTTLLQILAGMASPTTGQIFVGRSMAGVPRKGKNRAELAKIAGIVFQFPERYFLGGSLLEELSFGWPKESHLRKILALRLQASLFSVGITELKLQGDPRDLSGGSQRKVALATQLVRMPQLLLLDEPLAGLDWRARADVVNLLKNLKKDRTVLVVSHDLRELSPLVDRSWKMEMGGSLKEIFWPPENLDDQFSIFEERAAKKKKELTEKRGIVSAI